MIKIEGFVPKDLDLERVLSWCDPTQDYASHLLFGDTIKKEGGENDRNHNTR